jgi:hypothetical protein
MSNMKKIHGIFVCNNLKNVLNLDKDLYEAMNKKFKYFYIIDLSHLYEFKIEKITKSFKVFRPKTYNELENFLGKNSNIFFNHVPRDLKYLKFFLSIKKHKVILLELIRGNSIQLSENYYKKNNFLFLFKIKLRRAIYKGLTILNFINNYDCLFISTKNVKKYYHNDRDVLLNKIFFTNKFFKHKKIIIINDKIYDLSKNKIKSQKYIVYIDTPLSKIDYIPSKDMPDEVNKKKFYNLLKIHLDRLSKIYKKKIVICLHPKTNFNDVKKYFKNYICKRNKLWQYVDKAFLVTCIASTAAAYAIYNKKKILIFNSKYLNKFHLHRSEVLANSYKIMSLKVEETKINNLNVNKINTKKPYNILLKNISVKKKNYGIEGIISNINNY